MAKRAASVQGRLFDNSYAGLKEARAKTLDGGRANAASSDLAARTVRAWGAKWLDFREQSGIRAIWDDRNRWRVHVLEFAPWADEDLSAVSKLMALEWWGFVCSRRSSTPSHRQAPKKLAAQTLKNILNLVRRCFADAMRAELITSNPFEGLVVHRSRGASTKAPWRPLTLDQQMAGLGALACHPERWMVAFGLGSGIRQGEQWSLTLPDLLLEDDKPRAVLRFGSAGADDEEEDGPTKAGRVREVRLFGMALDAARRWVAQLAEYAPHNPDLLVFPTRRGLRRQCGKTFYAWRLLEMGAGRHVRWHDLRHTCATSLLAGWWCRPDGTPVKWTLEEVCAYLGHSAISVTEKYAKIVRALADDAALRMASPRSVVHAAVSGRALEGTQQLRGNMDNSNSAVDGGTTLGDRRSGRVVEGSGFENRGPTPEGVVADCNGSTPEGVDTISQRAELAELRAALRETTDRANENAGALFKALGELEAVRRTGERLVSRTAVTDADELAAVVERTKARVGACVAICVRPRMLDGLPIAPCGTRCALHRMHDGECLCGEHQAYGVDDVSRLDVVSSALHAEGAGDAAPESSATDRAVGEVRNEGGGVLPATVVAQRSPEPPRGLGIVEWLEQRSAAPQPDARSRKAILRIGELVGVPDAGGPESVVKRVADVVGELADAQRAFEALQRFTQPLERMRGAWELWTPEEVSREVAPMAGGVYDVPSESFAATELGIRERVTRRELSDADDGEERATLHLPRHGLEELCRERTAERDDVRARLRTAIGLLNDLDAVGVRASLFLNEEIGRQ